MKKTFFYSSLLIALSANSQAFASHVTAFRTTPNTVQIEIMDSVSDPAKNAAYLDNYLKNHYLHQGNLHLTCYHPGEDQGGIPKDIVACGILITRGENTVLSFGADGNLNFASFAAYGKDAREMQLPLNFDDAFIFRTSDQSLEISSDFNVFYLSYRVR